MKRFLRMFAMNIPYIAVASILLEFFMAWVSYEQYAALSESTTLEKPVEAEQLFQQMDRNNDGLLSEDEVEGPLKQLFSRIDTNNDKHLSRVEVAKAPRPDREFRPPEAFSSGS